MTTTAIRPVPGVDTVPPVDGCEQCDAAGACCTECHAEIVDALRPCWIPVDTFDRLRETDRLDPERAFRLAGPDLDPLPWAWSPDGVGVIWYATLADLVGQHY